MSICIFPTVGGDNPKPPWTKFPPAAAVLRYLQTEKGLKNICHQQIVRAAKTSASWDGWGFPNVDPASASSQLTCQSPHRPLAAFASSQSSPARLTTAFFGKPVGNCACCDGKICGKAKPCSTCDPAVDKPCCQVIVRFAICFLCICYVCSASLPAQGMQCSKCKHAVHAERFGSGVFCVFCVMLSP